MWTNYEFRIGILQLVCFISMLAFIAVAGIPEDVKVHENFVIINKCSNMSNVMDSELKIPDYLLTPGDNKNKSSVRYRLLEPKVPFKCTSGESEILILQLSNVEVENSPFDDYNANLKHTKFVFNDSKSYFKFTSNGIFTNDQDYFTLGEYCISSVTKSAIQINVCKSSCTRNSPCVHKCCEPGHSVSLTSNSCKPSGKLQWKPIFYEDPYKRVSEILTPHFILSNPECLTEFENDELTTEIWPSRNIITSDNETFKKISWRILSDGSVTYLGRSRKWAKLDSDKFCVDGILDFGEGQYFSGSPEDQVVLYCSDGATQQQNISALYVSMMFVASVFLLLTAFVYILLFDKQNIHGWSVLCFCCSMFLMYIFLAIAHLLGMFRTVAEESGSPLCVTIGIFAHFFFISTFCWLTLINFDLCWTFRFLSPGPGRSKGVKRFLCYLAFAWAIPLSVIAIGIILDHEFPDLESEIIVPEYGQGFCFLTSSARGPYLYYIIGALLTCNFLLITVTVFTIYRLRRNSKIVLTATSTKHHQSIKLFAKLFVIMGITWIFEILSWSLSTSDKIEWYWIILDMINLLQAIAIFIIFVCKQSTLNQIYGRIPHLKKLVYWMRTTSTSTSPNSNFKTSKKFANPMKLHLDQKTSSSATSLGFPVHKSNDSNNMTSVVTKL